MKVYVNSNDEIMSVGKAKADNLIELIIADEANPFEGWPEAKICCYKIRVNDEKVIMMTPYVDSRIIECIGMLGEKDEALETQLAEMDELAIELWENNETQGAINDGQDEAIIELFELLEN